MPRARKHLVCIADTPYYHVTARCVRRAFLCGVDRHSGQSYEHRRSWIEERIRILSSVFSISVCAYAVMSNHYHLVVKLCPEEMESWSDADVLERWTMLFRGPLLVQRYQAGEPLSDIEAQTLRSTASVYRDRLRSLSWFMKCLNEPIARRANAEDHCTGHFWEARFHSQALLSDKALIAAMVYVDLNPVRAGIATTAETSDYTSFRARRANDAELDKLRRSVEEYVGVGELRHFRLPLRPLAPFSGEKTVTAGSFHSDRGLPIVEQDYRELVILTGRIVIPGKRSRINTTLEPILTRLGISNEIWPFAAGGLNQHLRRERRRLKRIA